MKMKIILPDSTAFSDLNVVQSGYQHCPPLHTFGPGVRDHFLLHYIEKGKGTLTLNGISYDLHEKQGFYIPSDTVVTYRADEENPWQYVWIGFVGVKASELIKQCGLTAKQPIFTDETGAISALFTQMKTVETVKIGRTVFLIGLLYQLFALLCELLPPSVIQKNSSQQNYLKTAIQMIEQQYMYPLSVSHIADEIGIHRSYLSTLFSKHLGLSIQQYIVHFRMERACALLKKDNLSIAEVAHSVGYEDALLFSKMFKKQMGISPKHYSHHPSDCSCSGNWTTIG